MQGGARTYLSRCFAPGPATACWPVPTTMRAGDLHACTRGRGNGPDKGSHACRWWCRHCGCDVTDPEAMRANQPVGLRIYLPSAVGDHAPQACLLEPKCAPAAPPSTTTLPPPSYCNVLCCVGQGRLGAAATPRCLGGMPRPRRSNHVPLAAPLFLHCLHRHPQSQARTSRSSLHYPHRSHQTPHLSACWRTHLDASSRKGPTTIRVGNLHARTRGRGEWECPRCFWCCRHCVW